MNSTTRHLLSLSHHLARVSDRIEQRDVTRALSGPVDAARRALGPELDPAFREALEELSRKLNGPALRDDPRAVAAAARDLSGWVELWARDHGMVLELVHDMIDLAQDEDAAREEFDAAFRRGSSALRRGFQGPRTTGTFLELVVGLTHNAARDLVYRDEQVRRVLGGLALEGYRIGRDLA